MMDHEVKMQGIRETNEEKMRIDKEKEMQRQKEVQEKRRKEEERQKKAEIEAEKVKKREEELEKRAAEKEIEEERKKQEHQLQLLENAKERERKQTEFRQTVMDKLQKQTDAILKKKEEVEKKNEIKMQILLQKNKERAQQAEEKRIQQEQKFAQAKLKNDQELQRIKDEFSAKEHQNELKRNQFELERKRNIEERQMLALKHQQEIAGVLEKMQKLEEQKKGAYIAKQEKAEERKKQQDLENEQLKERKRKEEEENELKREGVKQSKDLLLLQRTQGYTQKLNLKEINAAKSQTLRHEELLDRINADNIKRFDRTDTVIRISRQNNHNRQILQQKINQKMLRADVLSDQKNELLQQRWMMRKEIDEQKKEIAVKMEKIHLGKIDPSSLMSDLKDTKKEDFFPNKTMSNRLRPLPPASPKVQKKRVGSPVPAVAHPLPQVSLAPISIPRDKRGSVFAEITKNNQKTKEIKIASDATEKDIQRIIDDMRQNQNLEMLRLLEDEKSSELFRVQQIAEEEKNSAEPLDVKQKNKNQAFLIAEKAKSQHRIQKLQDMHFEDIQKIRRQFNGGAAPK